MDMAQATETKARQVKGRERVKKKEKHIGFIYATSEGTHPSSIYKNQLPRHVMRLCNAYKPHANWRIYELVEVTTAKGTKYKILNQTQAFSIALIQSLFRLHHDPAVEALKLKMRDQL